MTRKRYTARFMDGSSGRWQAGGGVALIHLAILTVLLGTDRLTIHKMPDARPMTVYRIPDVAPRYSQPSRPVSAPHSDTGVPASVLSPRLDEPLILIQPEKASPPARVGGFDLLAKPAPAVRSLSQDDLLPSKETKLKQFFQDSAEENRLAREPSAGEDCKTGLAKDSEAASLPVEPFKDPIPLRTVCTKRGSAKDLARKNDNFSPK